MNGVVIAERAATFERIGLELREIRRELDAVMVHLDAFDAAGEVCFVGARGMIVADLAKRRGNLDLLIKHAAAHAEHPEVTRDEEDAKDDDEGDAPAEIAEMFARAVNAGGGVFSIKRKAHD